MSAVRPFRVEFDPDAIEDLQSRLRRTRWPEPAMAPGWIQGTPTTSVRELCSYWSERYDWADAERRLNRHPQFRTEIDGLFAEVIGPLAETFHVVCPSLPATASATSPARPAGASAGADHA